MKTFISTRKKNILPSVIWLLALAAAIAWRVKNIDTFGLNNDEGAYLMWARLVADGYSLYSQTHSVAEPLFIEMLALCFRLGGFSLATARLVILLTFVGTTGVLGWLSYRIAGWTGALLSLGILAFTPQSFYLSREVMAEMPATFLAVSAVAAAFLYFSRGNRWWLLLAGSLLAASGMMKPLYPAAALPIGMFIIFRDKNRRRIIADGTLFAMAVLTTLVLIVAWYPWGAFFAQAVQFRADLRATFPLDVSQNLAFIIVRLRPIWGVWVLAAMGFSVSAGTVRGWAWTLWLLGTFATLMWHTPLFGQHLMSLLPPLVLMSVECIRVGVQFWRDSYPSPKRWIWVVVLIFPLLNIPATVRSNENKLKENGGGRDAAVVQVLKTVTRPTDFVISDSLIVPLMANRLTPPPMGDIAFVAIKAGWQTSDRLIAMSDEYHVQAVANWALRLPWLPEYLEWAEQNFLVHKIWDNDHQLYFGRKLPPDAPVPHEQSVLLGDAILLRGYRVDTTEIHAGDILPLTLYWQAKKPIAANYTVFVQILDSQGKLVAQNDSQPLHGYLLTTQWQPGEIIPDRIDIPLSPDIPAGEYTVIAGMYDLNTLQRLPVAETSQNFVTLTHLSIGSK